MAHVRVGENAHYLADRVGLANVGKELIAQTLPLRRAAHQAGNVDEAHCGWDDPGRVVQPGERLEPRVRETDNAHVGLDRRERVVRCHRASPGQRVEQGGLAHVRQSDDSDLKAHPGESRRRSKHPGCCPRHRATVPRTANEAMME